MLAVMNKKPAPPPVIAAPPPPGTVVPVAGAPVAGTPISTPATGSTTLSDSDPAVQAGTGQLLSFDRFPTKDPFAQQAIAPTKAAAAAAKPVTAPPPPPPPPASSSTKQPAVKLTSAQISVNGATEKVGVNATFPAADPVFRLVSVTKTTAKIGIAGGSLSTGSPTVTVRKGKKVTLMNTANGTRYEIILVSVS